MAFGNFLKETIQKNLPSSINTTNIQRDLDNATAKVEGMIGNASDQFQESAVEYAGQGKALLAQAGSIAGADIASISSLASNQVGNLKKAVTGKLGGLSDKVTGAIPAALTGPAGSGLTELARDSGLEVDEFGKHVFHGKTVSPKSGGTDLPRFGAEGGIANKDNRFPMKLDNILNKFVSANYVLSLGILDIQEVNYPDETYIKNGPKKIIIKSGGGKPSAKQKMVKTSAEHSNGEMEFFIDDLEWNAIVNPTSHKHVSTNTTFSFKVTEPYSMGQFLEVLQIAALECGYTHYTEAYFILVIDWVGWDSYDNVKRISDLNNGTEVNSDGKPFKHSKKYAPFKFANATFSVSGGGCVYDCSAFAANDLGLNDSVQYLPVDITIAGENVHEMLQTGQYSLTEAINKHLGNAKREKEETNRYADHYIIQFPNDVDLASDQTPEDKSAGSEEPAVANPHKQGTDTKYISGQTMIDAMLRNVNEEGKRNGIGNSQIIYDSLLDMNQVYKDTKQKFFKTDEVLDETKVVLIKSEKAISFAEGTSINKIIEEVILSSQWATQNGPHGRDDKYGYKDWFKIECKVYPVHVPGTTAIRGIMPRIFLYRVIKYKQHGSIFSKPTAIAKGTAELEGIVVKKYDYIYTGQNKDIINFNVEYNNRFHLKYPSDLGNNSYSHQNKGSSATENQETDLNIEQELKKGADVVPKYYFEGGEARIEMTKILPKEEFFVKKLSENTQTANYTSATRAVPSSQKQEIARSFHEATINTITDMTVVEIEIWGDPYFIASSGLGNYSAAKNATSFIDETGAIAYEHKKCYIVIEFRTPTDIGPDGIMKFPGYRTNELVDHFSGIYWVTQVASTFSKGMFKQILKLVRQPNQSKIKADDTGNNPIGDAEKNAKNGNGAGAETGSEGPTSGDSSNSSSDSGGISLGPRFTDPRLSLTLSQAGSGTNANAGDNSGVKNVGPNSKFI